jgi:predicted ATP-dependent serine protease
MTIEWSKCVQCGNKVPKQGQCNKCGWLDSLNKVPELHDFEHARKVNDQAEYKQFKSIDQYIDMEVIRLTKEGKLKPQQQQVSE